tara:strand:- start:1146 stop:1595 length:450 start_codon:yes stop_codon:yes gene_type:complete
MELRVIRYCSREDFTLGMLMEDRTFLCYTLEDEHREEKVLHETRVPAGRYRITLRTVGGFHKRYTQKYGDMHKGMLWVRDVPGFEYILIHTGNTDEHTSGCLLTGITSDSEKGFIGRSGDAYKNIYPKIAKALEDGEDVFITYENFDEI